jgi:hypothetical protein
MDDELGIEVPPRLSVLGWYLKALGLRYVLAFVFVMILSGYLMKLAARRGQERPFVLLAIIPLPALIGFVSVFDGIISGLCCMGCGGPRWSEYADMFSMSLVGLQVGLWLTLPGFIVSLILLCRQALHPRELKS